MYAILLKFSSNSGRAADFMPEHKSWIEQGFNDGVFLLVGSIQTKQGGFILADGESKTQIEDRVRKDPFVAEEVVSAEVMEIDPARTDQRLDFLAR